MEATYFEHYARMNDLSLEGRQTHWPDYERLLSRVLPKNKTARVLDIGCGAGLLLEWLQQKGYVNSMGIDTDSGQVRFAKELGLHVDLVDNASDWLSVEKDFGLVVMTDVLEHVPNAQVTHLLKSIYSAMNDTGALLLRVPNATSIFATRSRYIDGTHERSYTEPSLTAALSSAGFNRIEISAENFGFPRSLRGLGRFTLQKCFRSFRRLEAVAELGLPGFKVPLSLNLIAICGKDTAQKFV